MGLVVVLVDGRLMVVVRAVVCVFGVMAGARGAWQRDYRHWAQGRGEMSQDKSFFVSRTELLAWLNDLLQLDYKKVEDCASGARTLDCLEARPSCGCR